MDIDISFTVCRMLLILVVIHNFFIVQYTGTVYRFNFWVNWGICPNLCSICTLIWLQRTNFPPVQKVFIFKRCTVVHSANYTCLRSQPAGKNHTVCKSWWKYSSWRLQVCNCKSCSDILPVLTWSLAQLIAARKYAALAIINIVCLLAAAPPGGSCCNQRLLPFFKIQPSQRAATICN